MEEKNKEAAILRAAEEEFLQKGYEGAKTVAIARRAGVTHAMLHYYFRSKENLYNQVLTTKFDMLVQSVLISFTRSDLPFLDRLRVGIEAHFDFLVQNPGLPRFVINELIVDTQQIELLRERLARVFATVVVPMQEELNTLIEQGVVDRVSMVDLVVDMVSLNAFVFIAMPIIEPFALQHYGLSLEEFLAQRKRENVELIMRRLKRS